MNEALKLFKKELHKHQGHWLILHEEDAMFNLYCDDCGTLIERWEPASLEPDYELHQAVDAITAIVDDYFGEEGWEWIAFDFDHIDNRIDEFRVYGPNKSNLSDDFEFYDDLLLTLEEDESFLVMMSLGFDTLTRGEYPKKRDD